MGKLLKTIALAFGPLLIETAAQAAKKKLDKLSKPKPTA